MVERDPQAGWPTAYAAEQYDDETGRQKVDIRQRVYWCVAEGSKRIDLEHESILAAQQAGLSDLATIVDVGSSYPDYLNTWQHLGHSGRLVAIEPNTAQLQGAPYWEPRSGSETVQNNDELRQLTDFRQYYQLRHGQPPSDLGRIQIVKAGADTIPVESHSVGLVTSMFMFYHVEPAKQAAALIEMKRLINPASGMFVLTTRGTHNKAGMRAQEQAISCNLRLETGQTYNPPPPINSGFTSEKARQILPQHYKYVYERYSYAPLEFKDPSALMILRAAHLTLAELYKDQSGNSVDRKLFERVLDETLAIEALNDRRPLTDQKHESLFLAADRPLSLPEGFAVVQ